MSRISVIIPNFNHGEYLPKLLNRIFTEQELQPIEVIVLDDGSTDDSWQILKEEQKHWPKLRIHKNDTNKGVCFTSNHGAKLAKGDFLVLRAADDFELHGYYKNASKLLNEYPQAAVCCGDIDYFGKDESLRQTEHLGISDTPSYIPPDELPHRFGVQTLFGHATMIRKAAFLKSGGFDPELFHLADWFCFLVAALRDGLCSLPQPVVATMLSHLSFGNRSASQSNDRLYERLCEKLENEWSDIVTPLLESPCLNFPGSPFEKWLSQQLESELAPQRSNLLKRISRSLDTSRRISESSGGIPQVITETLQRNKKALSKFSGHPVVLYGAGAQAQALMNFWRKDILPLPTKIIVTQKEPEDPDRIHGIDLIPLEEWEDQPRSLIILCSKSFESLFYETVRARFPKASILSFWDRSLTSFEDPHTS